MKKPIQINCLGRLEIYFNGVEQSMYMNSNKARELIAYLVTYQGAPVPKENVCTALWGEIPLQYSRDCLYKLLGKIQNIDIPFHIEKRRGIIQLHMDNISSDIVKFKNLVSQFRLFLPYILQIKIHCTIVDNSIVNFLSNYNIPFPGFFILQRN